MDGVCNLRELEACAAAVLPPAAYGYYRSGADDECTLHDNETAYSRWLLRPRVLVDVSACDTRVRLLGATLASPVLVAPMAAQRLAHAAGEVASAMTVDASYDAFLVRPTIEGLLGAVEEANRAVLADARNNPERFGMGTTVIAVGLTQDSAGVTTPTMLHVGDSRAYQLRDGALRQLSADHSVAEEWVRMGRLTPEEALVHPRRHQLTRAVGVDDNIEIDVMSLHVQPGDRILLCSDGLSNELDPDRLAEIASADAPLEDVVRALVQAAGLKARMLLQVHDELLFEVPNTELNAIAPHIKNLMENAMKLEIPVMTSGDVGNNWADAK